MAVNLFLRRPKNEFPDTKAWSLDDALVVNSFDGEIISLDRENATFGEFDATVRAADTAIEAWQILADIVSIGGVYLCHLLFNSHKEITP